MLEERKIVVNKDILTISHPQRIVLDISGEKR